MSMRTLIRVVLCMGVVVIATPHAFSQPPAVQRQSGGFDASSRYTKLYQGGSKANVKGNVLSTEDLRAEEGGEPGMRLKLDVAGKEVDVHLGPRWFVLEHDMNFSRGEPIEIVGARISLGDKPVILAGEVKQGEKTFKLREVETGTPAWNEAQRAPGAEETKTQPETAGRPEGEDDYYKPLTILSRNCAGCHQAADHPGRLFLNKANLSEKQTQKLMIDLIERSQMPPAHKNFKNTEDGKTLLAWLKAQEGKAKGKKKKK